MSATTAATARTTRVAKKPRPKSGSAARISANGVLPQHILTSLILGLYLAASAISFNGLLAIAPWTHVDPILYPMVPIFIDGAILAYKVAELILKTRGQYAAAKKAVVGTIFFTAISSLANGSHVISQWDGVSIIEVIGGVGIAVISPWAIWWAAVILTHVIVKPKPVRAATKQQAAKRAPAQRKRPLAATPVAESAE